MIKFPNCKINLGLRILEKRPDGFHNLETVFYPLPIHDALEIVPGESLQITVTGPRAEKVHGENICLKAWHLLKKDFPGLVPLSIYLHKTIPIGAGLGGGSADGAFMLMMLNEKFRLGLSRDQLIRYALTLGSDCPFFIINQPALATGRGEIMDPVPLDLSGYRWILVNPGIHISTAHAFSLIRPAMPDLSLRSIISGDIGTWRENLVNDFEAPVFFEYPEICRIKETLYKQGALYASMSGSGSTVFGIFKEDADLHPEFPENYFVRVLNGQV